VEVLVAVVPLLLAFHLSLMMDQQEIAAVLAVMEHPLQYLAHL
jgi:hypothetical protein